MKILALSDVSVPLIYSPRIRHQFADVDLIIGCGDLGYDYLEFVVSLLNKPLYYVRGNHDRQFDFGLEKKRVEPLGGYELHRRHVCHEGVLMAGIEGSLRYSYGAYQYSQRDMWLMVYNLVPRLMLNRARYGRYLDLFITHAPPTGIHDMDDLPHRGIEAFHWLDRVFQPRYHLHGHIHIYRPDTVRETLLGQTRVVNVFGFREIDLGESQANPIK
jgi:Icc-related predicted phosphoesterase